MGQVPALFAALVDDAAMFPPGNAALADAVAAHDGYRRSWFAPLVGPLVVPDQQLVALGAERRPAGAAAAAELEVSVINTRGVDGLTDLARRRVPGVRVGAVETPLADLGDLPGDAARLVSAAATLDDPVRAFVEVPYAPGWERAVEVLADGGLLGKVRTGGPAATDTPSFERLAHQLAVLVAAGLPFKATAGLHHAWPSPGPGPDRPHQHGFLPVLAAVDALAGGASEADAAELLTGRAPGMLEHVRTWSGIRAAGVRARLRSFGCCGVTDPVADLVALGLLRAPA